MSNLYHQQWTPAEKILLLTNVLQGEYQDLPTFLAQMIYNNNIVPKWNEIALPTGRSLTACQWMFNDLIRPRPGLSYSATGPTLHAPSPHAHSLHEKRSFSEQPPLQTVQRAIQPRPSGSTGSPVPPPTTNGEPLMMVRTFAADIGGDKRKKRGRPTKEEVEERDRALAAEGKVYEPKKRPSKKFRASTGQAMVLSESGIASSPVMQTPLPQTIEMREDSSSGKRRSRRQEQQSIEPSSPTTRIRSGSTQQLAQSPSDRLLATRGDREPISVSTSTTALPADTVETVEPTN